MASGLLSEGVVLNDRYRIVRVLGRGGMGTVYLAEHLRLDTTVAVKEVSGPRPDDEEYRLALQQCEQEARFLVRLNHPNLPRVMDAFIESDRFYLVMEYIEGVTLETRLREAGGGPLEVADVIEWGLQIADVLAYLHSQDPPIIFRDLKPANVMVQPDGNVRLIDFGIARRFQPGASKDTALLGSVGYSPPEQFGRHQTDARSDLYALGATLHHLLTGRDPAAQPFKFPPACSLNPQVPEALSRLIDECLALDPAQRPAGVHEVAMRLLAVRDAMRAHPPPPGTLAPVPAAEASTVPSVTVAAPTGPRIISAKLAEAEAMRRRESREVRHSTGGSATSTGDAGRAYRVRLLAVAGALAVIVGVTAAVLPGMLRRPAPRQVILARPITEPPPRPADLLKNTVVPPNVPAPSVSPPEPRPPRAVNQIVEIASAQAEGVVLDAQQRPYLLVWVKGVIQGQQGKPGLLSLFFYNAEGEIVPAANPGSMYANPDGQLSVAHSLEIREQIQHFEVPLTVPLDQFPAPVLQGGVKFRCIAFIDQKRVGETDLIDVPFNLSAAMAPAQGRAPGNMWPGQEAPPRRGNI
ncbi:MAG: protein kinase [Chloroherpetonaceae bacterium]|nr:protein kinase [Chthonomonadaceae bacterium]MDW8206908.1 protein kinase [Chloroherpetonaceae bacterium]